MRSPRRRLMAMVATTLAASQAVPASVLADCAGDACGNVPDPWSAIGPLLFGVVVAGVATLMAVSEARTRH